MSSKPVRIEFTLNEGREILISIWGQHLLNMTSPHWSLDFNQATNHNTPDILNVCMTQINRYDWLNLIINNSTTEDNTSPPKNDNLIGLQLNCIYIRYEFNFNLYKNNFFKTTWICDIDAYIRHHYSFSKELKRIFFDWLEN